MPYDNTYMWNLKCDVTELIYKQKQTHREHRFVIAKGWEEIWIRSLEFTEISYYT